MREQRDFKELILKDIELGLFIKEDELSIIFDVKQYLKHTDCILNKIFK